MANRSIADGRTPVARVRPDGPYMVTAGVVLVEPTTVDPQTRATLVLCRCGQSNAKPYCDGTHVKSGFRDPGMLPDDAPPGAPQPGAVTIEPTVNGPLLCRGPLTVQGADGRLSTADETWLCRCGHSRTKPYCDGSHERVGFIAP